jgi:penicillin-binding protein 2
MVDLDEKEDERRKQIFTRLNFLLFLAFSIFALIIFRLGYVQVIRGEYYTEKAVVKSDQRVSIPVWIPDVAFSDYGTVFIWSAGTLYGVVVGSIRSRSSKQRSETETAIG